MLERETPESTRFLDFVFSGTGPGSGVMVVGPCIHIELVLIFCAGGTRTHVDDEVRGEIVAPWCPRLFGKGVFSASWVGMMTVL